MTQIHTWLHSWQEEIYEKNGKDGRKVKSLVMQNFSGAFFFSILVSALYSFYIVILETSEGLCAPPWISNLGQSHRIRDYGTFVTLFN